MSALDKETIFNSLSRVDVKYLNGDKQAVAETFRGIVKSMSFLGFFDDQFKVHSTDDKG